MLITMGFNFHFFSLNKFAIAANGDTNKWTMKHNELLCIVSLRVIHR